MKKVSAVIGGVTALVLMLAAPGDAGAQQASPPRAGALLAGALAAERPTVTVNIVTGDLSGREKRDFDLLERAMRDMQTRGYVGLDRHLSALRRAMERAPATYPHTEKRAANDWIVRTLDIGETMVMATMLQASAVEAGVSNVTVRQQPNVYPLIALMLGSEAVERGRLDEAIAVLDQGLARQPDDGALIKEKASALQAAGRNEEALSLATEALASDSIRIVLNAGHLHRSRGFSLIELKRLPEARAAYDEALKLDPEDRSAKAQLAYIDGLEAGQPSVAPVIVRPLPGEAGKPANP
ncbi:MULTISPECIES: tetratricopeptide repeat protein [Brevundimonas]|uniref:tetratricopeptide repeat protein n=1 Tax=Brevundimonas TaxID=41275 RepID=UPI00190691D0|nr:MULTISPECIES: tetratricopeptide repeat protein [Brevundimonas]MBK1970124.1 tetratricopeptide repeat protein [Brevundimonas diminuta]MBK1974516.1 tetratricopeptide repeat protein [Brevundimonas diminuta]MDA0743157.1 tetratricopeptide repeat protein [Pseudomonadota bacterium]MDM8354215.1 tetratricopeptide repeat protein [Brevundimonas diminuta]